MAQVKIPRLPKRGLAQQAAGQALQTGGKLPTSINDPAYTSSKPMPKPNMAYDPRLPTKGMAPQGMWQAFGQAVTKPYFKPGIVPNNSSYNFQPMENGSQPYRQPTWNDYQAAFAGSGSASQSQAQARPQPRKPGQMERLSPGVYRDSNGNIVKSKTGMESLRPARQPQSKGMRPAMPPMARPPMQGFPNGTRPLPAEGEFNTMPFPGRPFQRPGVMGSTGNQFMPGDGSEIMAGANAMPEQQQQPKITRPLPMRPGQQISQDFINLFAR